MPTPPRSSEDPSQPDRNAASRVHAATDSTDVDSLADRDRLYFAYGSNLDAEDLDRWCRDHDHPSGFLEPVSSGYLLDHHLDFSHYSRRRAAGALNVRQHRGAVAPGVMFRVTSEDGWRALDEKEGRGTHYEAIAATACDNDGQFNLVVTYQVPVTGPIHHPTSKEYADAVKRGSKQFGLPSRYLEAAINQKTDQHLVEHLFIYGTLMSGECRENYLGNQHVRSRTCHSLPGELRDTGSGYPAFFWRGCHHDGLVQGENIDCLETSDLLGTLDQVEGFSGYDSSNCLYHRRLVPSSPDCQDPMWTYTYASGRQPMNKITSGCWKTYCRGTA